MFWTYGIIRPHFLLFPNSSPTGDQWAFGDQSHSNLHPTPKGSILLDSLPIIYRKSVWDASLPFHWFKISPLYSQPVLRSGCAVDLAYNALSKIVRLGLTGKFSILQADLDFILRMTSWLGEHMTSTICPPGPVWHKVINDLFLGIERVLTYLPMG